MNAETIARYTQLPIEDIRRWMSKPSHSVYTEQKYLNAINALDADYLEETLPFVHEVYEKRLRSLKKRLETYYGQSVEVMSSATLGDHLLSIVQNPETAYELHSFHRHILGIPVRKSLPILLDILEEMPEGAAEWQQATCLLSFPMINSV